ncbi:hypothetical protein [Sphingomonas sp. S6]|jgi:hypothetical protein|nr:hypothetical protein [uncultured Sphingomonas sp.]
MIDRRRVLAAVGSAALAPVARAIALPPAPPLLASSALAALLA